MDDYENMYMYHNFFKNINFSLNNYISQNTFDLIYEKIKKDELGFEILGLCEKRKSSCIVPPSYTGGDYVYKINLHVF